MSKRSVGALTVMNAVLCLCVILVHLNNAPLQELPVENGWFIAAFSVNRVLSFVVPAFLFLSGYKLFARYREALLSVGRFYLGRARKIVLPYLVAVAVYFVYFYLKGWVYLNDLPEYVLLGTLAAHFYYVVIAVQFYLLFPLLRWLVTHWPRATLAVSFGCTLVFQQFNPIPYTDRCFAAYLFYFVLGMLVSRCPVREKNTKPFRILPVFWLVSAIFHTCLSYLQVAGKIAYSLSGTVNLFCATLAILLLFCVCVKLENTPLLQMGKIIENGSYAVYLYHVLAIFILQYDVYPRVEWPLALRYGISLAVVYGAAIIYTCLKSRFAKIRAGAR